MIGADQLEWLFLITPASRVYQSLPLPNCSISWQRGRVFVKLDLSLLCRLTSVWVVRYQWLFHLLQTDPWRFLTRCLSNCFWIVKSSWYLGGVKEFSLTVSGNICCVVALLMGICINSSIGGSKCPMFIPFRKFTCWLELLMTKTCSVTLREIACTLSINFTSGSMYCDPMKQAVGVLMLCPQWKLKLLRYAWGVCR